MRAGARLTRRAATWLLGGGVAALAGFRAHSAEAPWSDLGARAALAAGDPWRLRRAFAKARRSERVTLGVIGGSITVGAFASTPQHSYAAQVLAWWRRRFPHCDARLINAGIGGTGSLYGAFRVQRDLLEAEPDVVIVEFAVNDAWIDGAAFEGLVRQILACPSAPAVVLLFMMWQGGGNDQEMQAKVGAHYHLPMVSFRDALWPEITAGRVRWQDDIVDTVHPNDAGHAIAARLVTSQLEKIDTEADPHGVDPLDPLPAPLHTDAFQFTTWRDASQLAPTRNEGWLQSRDERGRPVWMDAPAGGRIAFDWFGTGIVAQLVRPADDSGRVRFWIDGVETTTADARAGVTRNIAVVAEDLVLGKHDIAIERPDGPTGIGLVGLGASGVRPVGAGRPAPGRT